MHQAAFIDLFMINNENFSNYMDFVIHYTNADEIELIDNDIILTFKSESDKNLFLLKLPTDYI